MFKIIEVKRPAQFRMTWAGSPGHSQGDAMQIWGAEGARNGFVVESLYREIRAMRIYEGASEVQKIVVARF